MYCKECGSKCKKEDTFCGECGSRLEKEEQIEEKKTKEETSKEVKKEIQRKPMSKKSKILLMGAFVLVALLFGGYQLGNHLFSAKSVANTYIKALKKQDANQLYTYMEFEEDKTFVSKKLFKELQNQKENSKAIENYKITDVTYGSGKISATVSFKYTMKGSSKEATGQVYLTKQDKKKFFLFPNWKINSSNEVSTVKQYTIRVPKKAKVTYAGVLVDHKYLDENKNTSRWDDGYDVYVLPQVFALETTIKATLENGIELEEKTTPSNYNNSITLNLTKENLSEEMSKNINDKAKEILATLYNSVIDGKSFEEIKANFEGENVVLEELEKKYNSFKENLLNASSQLTKIDFKDVSIYSLMMEDGNLKIRFTVNYDYSVKYKPYFSEEEQTHDDASSNYMTLILGMHENNYYLVDFDYLPTYFSRY